MQYIAHYSFQGANIALYVENGIIWFDAAQISVPIGFFSKNTLAFEINMGSKTQLAAHSHEILLTGHRKRTLMISEGGILYLSSQYTHQEYQDFLEWLQGLKRNSLRLKNAIQRQIEK
jgi:hypothetical protein